MVTPDPFADVVVFDDDLLSTMLYQDLVGPLQHDRAPWVEQ